MSVFDYDELAAAGIETVVIEYSGSNDEGYINEITATPEDAVDYGTDLYRELESLAYDVLSSRHGGWEINEGSDGTITINVKERKAVLKHGEIRHIHHWTTNEV